MNKSIAIIGGTAIVVAVIGFGVQKILSKKSVKPKAIPAEAGKVNKKK